MDIGFDARLVVVFGVFDVCPHHFKERHEDRRVSISMVSGSNYGHHAGNLDCISLLLDDGSLLDSAAADVAESVHEGAERGEGGLKAHVADIGHYKMSECIVSKTKRRNADADCGSNVCEAEAQGLRNVTGDQVG